MNPIQVEIDRESDGSWALNITGQLLEIEWQIGMREAFQNLAPPAVASLLVINSQQGFSPEATATPYLGQALRIRSGEQTVFSGFISSLKPEGGVYGRRCARLEAHSWDASLSQAYPRLPPLQNQSSETILKAILDALPLRYHPDQDLLYLSQGPLDQGKLAGSAYQIESDTGIARIPYAIFSDHSRADEMISSLLEVEGGRFFVNRDGRGRFLNRHYQLLYAESPTVMDNRMQAIQYGYGADFYNEIKLHIQPLTVGAAGSILAKITRPIELHPYESRQMVIRFVDEQGLTLEALQVDGHLQATFVLKGHTEPIFAGVRLWLDQITAQQATLHLHNERPERVQLQHLSIRGTPLIRDSPLVIQAQDMAGIFQDGLRSRSHHIALLQDPASAANLAAYQLQKHTHPRPLLKAIDVNSISFPAPFSVALFSTLQIEEAQTAHSGLYFIIGEQHFIRQAGRQHQWRWILEPVDSTRFIRLDQSHIGDGKALVY